MRTFLLSLILITAPWASAWPHLQDALLGLGVLLAGLTLLTNEEVKANLALPYLFLLIFAACLSCFSTTAISVSVGKILQIVLFCALPVLLWGMEPASQKWIARALLFLCCLCLIFGLYKLMLGNQANLAGMRNQYVYAVALAAAYPFFLLGASPKFRAFPILLGGLFPLLLPMSICLASFSGLCVALSIFRGARRYLLAAAAVLLLSSVLIYAYNWQNVMHGPKNDLALKEGDEIAQRYAEMAAAFTLFSQHPVTGVGGGNYQANISACYGSLPKSNLLPAGGQCGWLVVAVEYGLAGLGALAALVVLALRSGRKVVRENGNDTIAIATGTGLLILCASGLFTVMLTRETGPFLFILLGLLLCRQPVRNNNII